MHRRALLASVGALAGGCLGSPAPGNGTTPTASTTETPSAVSCEPSIATDADFAEAPPTGGEFEVTELSTTTSYDRPDVRFVLEPSAFYSADAVERKADRTGDEQVVVDVSEVEQTDVRTAIEIAVRSGSWESDTLPDGLAETVERVDFFTGVSSDETYTHVGVTLYRFDPDEPPAIEFDAVVADRYVTPDDPGAVEFTLRNHSSRPQRVFSGTVPPFGMLHAEFTAAAGRFLLWRDYEDEGCFARRDDGWLRCDIGKTVELQPCEYVSRRYEILPSTTAQYPEDTVPPKSGTYRVTDSVTYSEQTSTPESTLSFETTFTLDTV